MDENNQPLDLGGWLVLVGIGVVIAPFRILYIVGTIYFPIFTDGVWETLTTKGSEFYDPLWGPLLAGELMFNTAMMFAAFYLMFLFFSKRRAFPKLYIVLLLASLVFIPFDAWVASFVLVDEPMFDPDTVTELARTAVAAAIWVPYMLVSKRVKATFLNPVDELESQQVPGGGTF